LMRMLWDEESPRWVVATDRHDQMRARFVVAASGPLNRPKLPGIRRARFEVIGRGGGRLSDKWADGLRTFYGFHSAGFPNLFQLGVTQTGNGSPPTIRSFSRSAPPATSTTKAAPATPTACKPASTDWAPRPSSTSSTTGEKTEPSRASPSPRRWEFEKGLSGSTTSEPRSLTAELTRGTTS
jgi:cation diffusion facilitator CzcD-associated flavoprotein CzcO